LDPNGIITPKYDSQESIYMDLLGELVEANSKLDSTLTNFGDEDLIFNGEPIQWKKFANSLRLRILNRCAGTPWSFTYEMVGTGDFTTSPGLASFANADNDMAEILNDPANFPIISCNEDNVQLSYPEDPSIPNFKQPIFRMLENRSDFSISETMINWLEARSDPRLPIYAQMTQDYLNSESSDPYVGAQNGRKLSTDFPAVSKLGERIGYDQTTPVYVLTYDEIEFIKAEYYLRSGDETSARACYEAGIMASMERWEVTLDSNSTYLSEPEVDWDNANTEGEKYQLILEQKWAAMFGQGWQAWHEVRRTGFPARIFEYELEGTFFPDMGMPVRVRYPDSEYIQNGINLAEAISRQNIELTDEGYFSTDGIKSQMWWHTRKNPIPTEIDSTYWPKPGIIAK
jgi:hypothetical protein